MFIQVLETPNPNTLKFLPGKPVSPEKIYSFIKGDEATVSPLAQKLLNVTEVEEVFLGGDFLSLSKTQAASWETLRPLVLSLMTEHFLKEEPVVAEESQVQANTEDDATSEENSEHAEIVKEIKVLIQERVTPFVLTHGGNIAFKEFKEGVVYLELFGACSGCPSAAMTLKMGIENMLRHYIPEVQAVEAVNL